MHKDKAIYCHIVKNIGDADESKNACRLIQANNSVTFVFFTPQSTRLQKLNPIGYGVPE